MNSANAALYEPAREPRAVIAHHAQPFARIITPAKNSRMEEFAAKELQHYLARISDASLPIAPEDAPDSQSHPFTFYVGATRKAAQMKIAAEAARLGNDGFVLRSVPGGLVILGRNDLGTVFAVYELLERYFDVRWFMPGALGEHIPRCDDLGIGQVSLDFKPSFRARWVGDGEWALRQRMNVHVTAGGQPAGINWKWHFHTFQTLIPPKKYYPEHPEYFAMVKGKRAVTDKDHGNQLCTANPEVVREVAKNLIAALDAEPGIEIIALSPNDGGKLCECAQCRAFDEAGQDWFGRHSRRMAIFNNEVARLVRKKHPEVMIKVGAYTTYTRPPLDADFRPEQNLIYQLCHLYFCHNHPLGGNGCKAGLTYDPAAPHPAAAYQPNQEFERILDQWIKLTPHLYIYEYYEISGMNRDGLPWPLVHAMRTDIPYYRDRGVEGFYSQVREDTWHRLGLNYYVAAKLCWNSDLNADALLDDYFTKFYGPAGEPMKAFFSAMEEAMQAWNGCASYGIQGWSKLGAVIGPQIFTPLVMRRLDECLAEAMRRAAGDRLIAERVALAQKMQAETRAALAGMPKKD